MPDRYEYDVVGVALEPRIAEPCKEIRALFAAAVVAVRARTERVAAAFARDVAADARDTTLREPAAFARFTAGRPDTARDAVPLGVVVRATVVRLAFARLRGLARPERGFDARPLCGAATEFSFIGAIGSANTERIDKNVEHTKNAPASKNTVPMAFLNESAIF